MINRSRRVLVVDFGFGSGAGRKEGKEGRAVVVELYKKKSCNRSGDDEGDDDKVCERESGVCTTETRK